MNETMAQIAVLLARKREIDRLAAARKDLDQPAATWWLFDAVELLLQIELERQNS